MVVVRALVPSGPEYLGLLSSSLLPAKSCPSAASKAGPKQAKAAQRKHFLLGGLSEQNQVCLLFEGRPNSSSCLNTEVFDGESERNCLESETLSESEESSQETETLYGESEESYLKSENFTGGSGNKDLETNIFSDRSEKKEQKRSKRQNLKCGSGNIILESQISSDSNRSRAPNDTLDAACDGDWRGGPVKPLPGSQLRSLSCANSKHISREFDSKLILEEFNTQPISRELNSKPISRELTNKPTSKGPNFKPISRGQNKEPCTNPIPRRLNFNLILSGSNFQPILSGPRVAMEEWQRGGGRGAAEGWRDAPHNPLSLQEVLEASLSPGCNAAVTAVLEQVQQLSELQLLQLYLRLPTQPGTSAGVEGGSGGAVPQVPPPAGDVGGLLHDPLKQQHNPLGSRSEIALTITWVRTHLSLDTEVSMPKKEVYDEYTQFCAANRWKPLSSADFGKVMKQVFPNVRPRRLGQRGASKYCYSGLRKCYGLPRPPLPDLFCDEPRPDGGEASPAPGGGLAKNLWRRTADNTNNNTSSSNTTDTTTNNTSWSEAVVLEWAQKVLSNTSCNGDTANTNTSNGESTPKSAKNRPPETPRKGRGGPDPGGGSPKRPPRAGGTDGGVFSTLVELAEYLVAEKLVESHPPGGGVRGARDGPPLQRSTAVQLQRRLHDREQKRKLQDTSPSFSSSPGACPHPPATCGGLPCADKPKSRRRNSGSSSLSSSANSSRNPSGDSASSGVSSLSSVSSLSTKTEDIKPPSLDPFGGRTYDAREGFAGRAVDPKLEDTKVDPLGRPSDTKDPFGSKSFDAKDPFGSRSSHVKDPFGNGSSDIKDPFGNRSSDVKDPFGNRSSDVKDLFGNRSSDAKDPFGNRSSDPSVTRESPLLTKVLTSGSGAQKQGPTNSIAGSVITTIGNSPHNQGGASGHLAHPLNDPKNIDNQFNSTQTPLVLMPETLTEQLQWNYSPSRLADTYSRLADTSTRLAEASCSGGQQESKLQNASTRFKSVTPKLNTSFRQYSAGPSTAPARLALTDPTRGGTDADNPSGRGGAPDSAGHLQNPSWESAFKSELLGGANYSEGENLQAQKHLGDNLHTQKPVPENVHVQKHLGENLNAQKPMGENRLLQKLTTDNCLSYSASCVAEGSRGSFGMQVGGVIGSYGMPSSGSREEDEDGDVHNEEKLSNLRKALAPIVGGAPAEIPKGPGGGSYANAPVGATFLASKNMDPCRGLQRRACEFAPIQAVNKHGTANTSANVSPFTSPQMTPVLSRSRHNSGQSSTYITPRTTPFNPEDNLQLGASANSTCSTTPFVSPLTTPFARSRHSSSQNHRLGGPIGQLNPGSTIGGPCPAGGSRSRHSSGARRNPYSVPEDHPQHHGGPHSHHQRVQQRRLRNSSGGGGIPPSPHSAPLSPLIDGQEFYCQGLMQVNEGPQGDYRRRHTSAGPHMPTHPPPAPLTQNHRVTILSNNQPPNPTPFSTSRPNVSQLQLNPVIETPMSDPSNRPQSVPLPDILTNQQYSLSVPSTPLLHHNQYQGSLNHGGEAFSQGNVGNPHVMRHFSFDSSLPPSCAPTPVPSEFNDFTSDSCLERMPDLESFGGLENLESMGDTSPPTFGDTSTYDTQQQNPQNNSQVNSFSYEQFTSSSTALDTMYRPNFSDGGGGTRYDPEDTSNPFISAHNYSSSNYEATKPTSQPPASSTLSCGNTSTYGNSNPPQGGSDTTFASLSSHSVFSPPSGVCQLGAGVSAASELTLNALNTDTNSGFCNTAASDLADVTYGSLDDVFGGDVGLVPDQDLAGLDLDN